MRQGDSRKLSLAKPPVKTLLWRYGQCSSSTAHLNGWPFSTLSQLPAPKWKQRKDTSRPAVWVLYLHLHEPALEGFGPLILYPGFERFHGWGEGIPTCPRKAATADQQHHAFARRQIDASYWFSWGTCLAKFMSILTWGREPQQNTKVENLEVTSYPAGRVWFPQTCHNNIQSMILLLHNTTKSGIKIKCGKHSHHLA